MAKEKKSKKQKAEEFKKRMAKARKNKGKKKGKKAGGRKKFLFAAPADFKPFFLHIVCRTGKDGLISSVDGIRWKGRPDNPKAKSVRLSESDPKTLAAIAARIGGTSFVTNVAKRLPAKTSFRLDCRVRKNKEDKLGFGVREIKMLTDEGKKKTLSKKDPVYRRLRRCVRFMPAAFVGMNVEFPKIKKEKKGKKSKKDDD